METSQGNVTLRNCENFQHGCPDTNIWKDEFYRCKKYYNCFHIINSKIWFVIQNSLSHSHFRSCLSTY